MGHNAYRWAGINISGADAIRIAMRAVLDSGLVKFMDVTNGSGSTAPYSSPHSVSAPRPSQQHQPGRGAAAGPKQRAGTRDLRGEMTMSTKSRISRSQVPTPKTSDPHRKVQKEAEQNMKVELH